MIAALMDDESSGDKLLDAARKLCSAFSDLLKATEPETKEVLLRLFGKSFFFFYLFVFSSKIDKIVIG